MSGRDDFPPKVKEILAKRAGYMCSNPSCNEVTSGPNSDPMKATNIGVAAHICAAASGGPRYDPSMTEEPRKNIHNGIWLCQKCGKLIDSDEARYSVQLLREWKAQHESRLMSGLQGPIQKIDNILRILDSVTVKKDIDVAFQFMIDTEINPHLKMFRLNPGLECVKGDFARSAKAIVTLHPDCGYKIFTTEMYGLQRLNDHTFQITAREDLIPGRTTVWNPGVTFEPTGSERAFRDFLFQVNISALFMSPKKFGFVIRHRDVFNNIGFLNIWHKVDA